MRGGGATEPLEDVTDRRDAATAIHVGRRERRRRDQRRAISTTPPLAPLATGVGPAGARPIARLAMVARLGSRAGSRASDHGPPAVTWRSCAKRAARFDSATTRERSGSRAETERRRRAEHGRRRVVRARGPWLLGVHGTGAV
jgi:uncharacterized protein RhaS with RHS repeats